MSRIDDALRRAQQSAIEPAEQEIMLFPLEPTAPPATTGWDDESGPGPEPDPVAPLIAEPAVADLNTEAAGTPKATVGPTESANEKLVVTAGAQPIAVEQYRKLAAALHQVHIERGTRIVMVTSALAGEGKTLTAVNLALTIAESFGRQVLLIDADLRRPTIHQVLEIPNVSGLNDCLKADQDAKLPLIEVSARLTVLPAGRPNPDPMSGLTSDRMRRIVDEAAAMFDWVILDTPPVGLLPDAKLLAEMVDMVVLVVGANSTPCKVVQRTVQAIDPQRIVGVVLNRVNLSHSKYNYYDHGYYQGEN